MRYADMSCDEFVTKLASSSAVPGGGGASALVGAIGMALGNMVGSLTVGKKKYKDVEEDILKLIDKACVIREDMLKLIDEDAKAFEPLSKAYGLPKNTPKELEERNHIMEAALRTASETPLRIMEKCCEALLVIKEFAEKGSVLAVSDAGVACSCTKAALYGASLNVYINTGLMKDTDYAEELNKKADDMLSEYGALADDIFDYVMKKVRK